MKYERKIVEKTGGAGIGTHTSATAVVAKSSSFRVDEFRKALAECRAAEQQGGDIAGPLGTFLDRLYLLMDVFPALKQDDHVCALRFARARHVHQHASLEYRDAVTPSTWRTSSQLPKPEPKDRAQFWNPDDAQHYDNLLVGKPVTDALTAAEQAVNTAIV